MILDGYGDEVPDDEFVGRWRAHAETTARKLVPESHASYDDLVQEALIHVWRTASARPGVSATYLAKGARMRPLQVLQGAQPIGGDSKPGPKSRPALVGVDWSDPECPIDEPVAGDEALEAIEWAYHRGRIAEALDGLTERDREYVYRRFWLGETDTELAPILGVSNKALGSRWTQTIRPHLRAALAEQPPESPGADC